MGNAFVRTIKDKESRSEEVKREVDGETGKRTLCIG